LLLFISITYWSLFLLNMAHYNSFEELEIFILAKDVSNEVWQLMNETTLRNDYKLRDQINAASGSIMDNIAEGFGRGGNKEFIMFLSYARGSCTETRSQLIRAHDRNHISAETFKTVSAMTIELEAQISKFINYLRNSQRRGSKFD